MGKAFREARPEALVLHRHQHLGPEAQEGNQSQVAVGLAQAVLQRFQAGQPHLPHLSGFAGAQDALPAGA